MNGRVPNIDNPGSDIVIGHAGGPPAFIKGPGQPLPLDINLYLMDYYYFIHLNKINF